MDTNLEGQTNMALIKNPWKAVFLNKLFTGVGHIYAGARSRGIFLIILTVVLTLISVGGFVAFIELDRQETSRAAIFATIIALPILAAVHIFALFNGYKLSRKFNRDHNIDIVTTRQKKSWLAVFLSYFIFPGIGQLYNGQVFKGIFFIIAAAGLITAETLHDYFFFLYFVLCFFSLKDAFDSAEKRNNSAERFLYQGNRLLVFITVVLFFNAIPFGSIIKENFLKAYNIRSASMMPTLHLADLVLIDKRQKTIDNLCRGDIIVFPYPENPEKSFIKRAIALGGDKVQFANGQLYINDQLVSNELIQSQPDQYNLPSGPSKVIIYEEFLDNSSHHIQYVANDHTSYSWGPIIVPSNAVFVLGDNRDNSQDSRVFGSIPRDTIEGKALKIYWSWDLQERKVNWERIGQTIL